MATPSILTALTESRPSSAILAHPLAVTHYVLLNQPNMAGSQRHSLWLHVVVLQSSLASGPNKRNPLIALGMLPSSVVRHHMNLLGRLY